MTPLIFLIVGIIGLYFGSGYVVESAKNIAEKLKISHTLIGLTIISIGTSIPEIMTSLFSGLKVRAGIDASGIAVGTNIGSSIAQITFILGFTALFGTMYATKKLLKREGLVILSSIVVVFILSLINFNINIVGGAVLIFIYLIYLYYAAKDEKFIGKVFVELTKLDGSSTKSTFKNVSLIGLGIGILIFASDLVVGSALKLADTWGVANSFIGVMIIGVGTGLPELSTAVRAIFKKAGDLAIGTLIGSNITNIMFALPIGAVAAGAVGLNIEKNLVFFDIPFWFVSSILAFILFRRNMCIGKEDKKEGLVLIGLYIIFVFLKLKFFLH